MVDKKQYPMPLGVNTAVLNKKLPSDVIEEFGLLVPDEYYVIVFEKDHSYGPLKMDSAGGQINYLGGWLYYWSRCCFTAEDNAILEQIIYQIDWTKVIFPFFSRIATDVGFNGIEWWGIPTNLLKGAVYYVAVIYLLLNDYSALVKLGAQSSLVMQLKQRIPTIEQNYIDRMAAVYKDTYLTEAYASDWDKMWMAYFGFRFREPPPPPPPPPSLPDSRPSRPINYKEPLVNMGSGIGVKGHFAFVSYVDPPHESLFENLYPNIFITNVFRGVKSISDVAFWKIDGVWRVLDGQNEIIINGWRWNGVYLWQSRQLLLIHDVVVRLKGMWVYCDEAFYKLFNYLKDTSTTTQYRVFSGFYGSDIQALRARVSLDANKVMVVRNQEKFSFVDVTSFTLLGSTPGVLFGNLRLLKLSANDVFVVSNVSDP